MLMFSLNPIESTAPDIIIGTETWLDDSINSSEIFHPKLGYSVFRRNRPSDPHGGILIAVKDNLEMTNITKSKGIEIISGTLNITKTKTLVKASFYRPPDKVDEDYLISVQKEISDLKTKHKNANFLLSGDFNLPDINWARPCENVSYAICEQQRCRSACASALSDQHLFCSLLR